MTQKTNSVVPFEHERRFFPNLESLPSEHVTCPKIYITQVYLEDGLHTRIRDESTIHGDHTYLKTRKFGSGVSRQEDEVEIGHDEFCALWEANAKAVSLIKNRYFFSWDGVIVEINYFHGDLEGYVQIEVEFATHEEAVAFVPPVWFGAEVTDDPRHGNYSLAKNGCQEILRAKK